MKKKKKRVYVFACYYIFLSFASTSLFIMCNKMYALKKVMKKPGIREKILFCHICWSKAVPVMALVVTSISVKARNCVSWCYKGFLRCHQAVTMYLYWHEEKTNTLLQMDWTLWILLCSPFASHQMEKSFLYNFLSSN